MECVAPSAETWRDQSPHWSDEELSDELHRAWSDSFSRDPSAGHIYHDWTNFRAATLREARKRGLDLSIAGAAAHERR